MTTATWNGTVIAQSDDTVIVEGSGGETCSSKAS